VQADEVAGRPLLQARTWFISARAY